MQGASGGDTQDYLAPAASRRAASRSRYDRLPCRRRMAGGVVLLVAAGVILVTALLPWWYYSETGINPDTGHRYTNTILFQPGDSTTAFFPNGTENGNNTTTRSYGAANLSAVAPLYEEAVALLVFGAFLLVVAGLVGVLSERGIVRARGRGPLVGVLGLVAFLIVLFTVIYVPYAQPSHFNTANPGQYCTTMVLNNGNVSSPCNSFSGSFFELTGIGGFSVHWGGAAGWYVGVLAVFLTFAATLLWLSALREPWVEVPPMVLAEATAPVSPPPRARATPRLLPRSGSTAAVRRPVSPPPARPTGLRPSPRALADRPRPDRASAPPPRPVPRPAAPPPAPQAVPVAPAVPVTYDLASLTEVEALAGLKQQVDSGTLTSDQFAREKARLLAQPPVTSMPEGTSGPSKGEELATLEALRDAGAISDSEFVQFRRRVFLKP